MNTIYVLGALLLLALLFIEISFSLESKRKEQVKNLLKLDDSHLLEELGRASRLLKLCLISGLLLSALYAVNTFAGSEIDHISEWGFTHWLGASIGLVVIVTLTLSQSFAHSTPMHHIGRFVVIILMMVFAIFSEVSNPMEREEMKVAQKSQDSPVFQAVLNKIKGGSSNQPDYSDALAKAQANVAQHQFELERCQRHADKGIKRVQRCEAFENKEIAKAQAHITSYQQANVNAANQSQVGQQALIQQAKALEKNADNHTAVIKFIKTALDTDYQHAMVLAALILIVAFEAGFGFAGYNVAVYKEALIQKGNEDILYAVEAKRIKAAHAFREKTNRYKRDMLTTQDNGSPKVSLKQHTSDKQEKDEQDLPEIINDDSLSVESKTNNIHQRAHDAVTKNREREDKKISQGESPLAESGLSLVKQYAADYRQKKDQPITAFTHNQHTGTHERNYDLFGRETRKTQEQLAAEILAMRGEIESLKNRSSKSIPNRTRTVHGESGKVDLPVENQGDDTWSILYQIVSKKIQTGELSPTTAPMKKVVYAYLKSQKETGEEIPNMPAIQDVVCDIQQRLLTQNIIVENSEYGRGKSKYIKA